MSLPVNKSLEPAAWLELLERKVASIRFGSIQIVLHEGRVTQIESTEKFRLANESKGATPQPAQPDAEST